MAAARIHLDQVFRSFDKDGDGKVSAGELRMVMATAAGEAVSLEEAEAMVESADSNGDGMLDLEEFGRLVDAAAEGEEEETTKTKDLRAAFKLYEGDGERGITPRSLRRMLSRLGSSTDVDACSAMIGRFDLDGDGVLSFEEFTAMMVAA